MSDFIKDMFIEVREKPKEKNSIIDVKTMMEMIEQTMASLNAAHIKTAGYALTEEEATTDVTGEDEKKSENVTEIKRPIVKITEAWGDPAKTDRKVFEAMMSNIEGGTVAAKLASVNGFLKDPPETAGADISKIMSYLIFLDTFASIINDYGASVTGFLFEAFLAALFGGTSIQVEEPGLVGAVGSLPIEDNQLYMQLKRQRDDPDADPEWDIVPYSLKVLRHGGVVHGSFKNLVDFFLDPNPRRKSDSIVYLIVIKEKVKEDRPEKKAFGEMVVSGRLLFYEFAVTRENFMTLIGAPSEVAVWGYVPVSFKTRRTIDPAKNIHSEKARVAERGKHKYRLADGSPIGVEIIEPTTFAAGENILKFMKTGEMQDILKGSAAKLYTPAQHREIMAKFGPDDPEEISREKFAALKQTKGYGSKVEGGAQWSIPSGVYATDDNLQGDLLLDTDAIRAKAIAYTQTLNGSLVSIFNSLGALSDNINNYFIAGDVSQGLDAKKNAEELRRAVNEVIPEEAIEQRQAAEE